MQTHQGKVQRDYRTILPFVLKATTTAAHKHCLKQLENDIQKCSYCISRWWVHGIVTFYIVPFYSVLMYELNKKYTKYFLMGKKI